MDKDCFNPEAWADLSMWCDHCIRNEDVFDCECLNPKCHERVEEAREMIGRAMAEAFKD